MTRKVIAPTKTRTRNTSLLIVMFDPSFTIYKHKKNRLSMKDKYYIHRPSSTRIDTNWMIKTSRGNWYHPKTRVGLCDGKKDLRRFRESCDAQTNVRTSRQAKTDFTRRNLLDESWIYTNESGNCVYSSGKLMESSLEPAKSEQIALDSDRLELRVAIWEEKQQRSIHRSINFKDLQQVKVDQMRD